MKGTKLRGWRRIANAMWQGPNDPQIYGSLDVDATAILRFVDGAKRAGLKITPTHLVGRAIGLTLRDVPELNVRIVGDEAIPRPTADIFFIAATEQGRDLSGVKIEGVERKSVAAIAEELTARASAAKAGDDPDNAKSKRTMDALPLPVLRVALRFAAWFTGDLDRGAKSLGLVPSPFGSAVVTSVGAFGLPMGFAPLSWMYRAPLLVLVGTIADKPVAIDGKVEVRPVLPIAVTIDHRFVDGFHIGRMMKTFRTYLDAPAAFEPELARKMAATAPS